jgi:D-3-phosphoglycerate dehydrogenase
VFTNTVKGIGQLSVRLRDADVLVLIRERTHFPAPAAREAAQAALIVADRPHRQHIDIDACTRLGIAVAEGPARRWPRRADLGADHGRHAPAAAVHRQPQARRLAAVGLKAAAMPPNFGIGMVLRGRTLGIWGYGKIGQLVAGYGRAFGMQVQVWGSEASRARAVADGHEAAESARGFFAELRRAVVHLRLNDARAA